MIDTRISLEVNPSLEIEINKNEKVLDVKALNSEARTVIGDMKLEGSDLEVAVNALIGSMLKNGYISDISNSILISVDSHDQTKGRELQERLSQEVSSLLSTNAFSGAVLSQTISGDSESARLAEQQKISIGKAQLINSIAKQNSAYSPSELSALSINQLNLISSGIDGVESRGTASDKSYIGAQAALSIAKEHAGISDDIRYSKIEMDYENGIMVYEIEFRYKEFEYDYDIEAKNGNVISSVKEYDDDHIPSIAQNSAASEQGNTKDDTVITPEKAREAALRHAGIAAENAFFIKCELDHDDGRLEYDIEFLSDGRQYEYELDAVTGEVYK